MDLSLPCRKLPTSFITPKLQSKKFSFTCKAAQVSMNKKANFYEILSLDSMNVGTNVIKKAYKRMALRFHPDVCPSRKKDESTRMFIELQRAYETLSDPIMRERYDYELTLVGNNSEDEECEERKRRHWMNQLNELKVRSNKRMGMKKQS